jgi:hypothetical protein
MPSDALPDDLDTLKAMLLAERCESERLRQIIKELQRHRFGRRAETLPEEQMLLGLEDVAQVEVSSEAREDTNAPDVRATRAHKRRGNRGSLQAHLPRIEVVVDIDDKSCPCCGGDLHRIDEDRSEWLDMVPAQFRVLAHPAAQIRLPIVRRWCRAGACFGQADRGRIADRGHHRPGFVSPICPPRHRSRLFDAGGLGGTGRRASASAARTSARQAQAEIKTVSRRDDAAGARPRPRSYSRSGFQCVLPKCKTIEAEAIFY